MCLPGVDFGTWRWGGGGGKKTQKPATQICHRLRNQAQLSQRGMHPGDPRVRPAASGSRSGPFLNSTPPPRRPAERPPPAAPPPLPSSPAPLGNPPGLRGSRPPAPSQGSARSALVPPPVRPQPLRPSFGKRTLGLPGRAGAEGAGGKGGRRPGPGCLPLPPPTPQQVAPQRAARALALPPSLSRSLARSVPVTWAGSRTVPRGRAPGALRLESKWH